MQNAKTLNIRPTLEQKFDKSLVRGMVKALVAEELGDRAYEYMYASEWARSLSRKIHDKLKEKQWDRYKFIIQVVIGEKQGQGMKTSAGCLWDDDTDGCVSVVVSRETLYCLVTVFFLYCYCLE